MTLESLNYLSSEYYRRALAGEIGGLTEEHALLFDHLRFDPEGGGKLVTDVDVEIPLSTLRWSDQWAASSGGASLYFQSADQNVDFTPVMSGVKMQAIPANQDESGLVRPFYRKPSANLFQASLKGDMSTNSVDVTPYSGSSVLTSDIEVYGLRAVLGEPLKLGDDLRYTLYSGSDDTGAEIFTQRIPITADREPGFDFTGWWTNPAVAFAGDTVYAKIVVTPIDGSGDRIMLVRSIDTDPNVHWNELQLRSFVDVPVLTEDYLTPVTVTTTGTIEISQQYAVDTTGGAITLTVDEGLTSFVVFDVASRFHQNSCTAVIGVDTYEMNKKDRQYNFWHNGTGWQWSEIERETR